MDISLLFEIVINQLFCDALANHNSENFLHKPEARLIFHQGIIWLSFTTNVFSKQRKLCLICVFSLILVALGKQFTYISGFGWICFGVFFHLGEVWVFLWLILTLPSWSCRQMIYYFLLFCRNQCVGHWFHYSSSTFGCLAQPKISSIIMSLQFNLAAPFLYSE